MLPPFLWSWVRAIFAALLVGVAAPASAATIGINGAILTASADGGDDVLVASVSGGGLVFNGVAFAIVTPGCSAGTATTVTCSLSGISEVRILMGAGDDVVDLTAVPDLTQPSALALFQFLVLGQSGNDVLLGTRDNFNGIWGGAGDDVLIGSGLFNCLSGGPGNNLIIPGDCGAEEPAFPPAQPLPTNVAEPHVLALLLGILGVAVLLRRRGAPFTRLRAQLPWILTA